VKQLKLHEVRVLATHQLNDNDVDDMLLNPDSVAACCAPAGSDMQAGLYVAAARGMHHHVSLMHHRRSHVSRQTLQLLCGEGLKAPLIEVQHPNV
jgi:hypothetical protein